MRNAASKRKGGFPAWLCRNLWMVADAVPAGNGGCGTPPPQDGGEGTQPPYRPPSAVTSDACEALSSRDSRQSPDGLPSCTSAECKPVPSAPPAPYSWSAHVDDGDQSAAGRPETGDSRRRSALDPGFHGVPTIEAADGHPSRGPHRNVTLG